MICTILIGRSCGLSWSPVISLMTTAPPGTTTLQQWPQSQTPPRLFPPPANTVSCSLLQLLLNQRLYLIVECHPLVQTLLLQFVDEIFRQADVECSTSIFFLVRLSQAGMSMLAHSKQSSKQSR